MKMLVYIDEYLTIQYDKNRLEMIIEWRKASARLLNKNIARRFMLIASAIKKYRPKYVFSNFEDMVYSRIWGEENLFYHNIHSVMINSGVEKFAYIKSNDKITKVLFDQLLYNSELKKVEMKNFKNPEEAEKWLLQEQAINKFNGKFAISA
ncbi:MAG: hypothetical protein L3J74_15745 [Bacteroidales bacterium]|nr:hypothetical protein [Bacteroidales bacterium]